MNAQFERVMRKMDATPPKRDPALEAFEESVDSPASPAGALCVDCALVECAPAEEISDPLPGDGGELKKRQSSSCVASEGTFPAHITHSERCAGGLGWYSRRTRGGRLAAALAGDMGDWGDPGPLSGKRSRSCGIGEASPIRWPYDEPCGLAAIGVGPWDGVRPGLGPGGCGDVRWKTPGVAGDDPGWPY